jgi:hypothetical protein
MNTQKHLLSRFAVGVLGIVLTLGVAQRARTAEYSQDEENLISHTASHWKCREAHAK